MGTPSLVMVIYIPGGALALTVSFMTTTAIFAVSAGTKILKQGGVLMPVNLACLTHTGASTYNDFVKCTF